MITRYDFGKKYETSAIVREVEYGSRLPYFETFQDERGYHFSCPLGKDDAIYGLGESMNGINKRGARYVMFNSENMNHKDDMLSMYGSHNFFVVDGERKFGVFFDTPTRAVFDFDVDDSSKIDVLCEQGVVVYFVEGESAYDIARQFLKAIGQSYLPPLWAFGFGQSRWGYKNEKDIRKIARKYKKADLPLEYVCLDIDYMDRYIDFSVDTKRFPDMKGLVSDMKKEGIRLVPIVDAGIKIEPGNKVYDEGVEKNYFCKNLEGGDFGAQVWPGMTHFTDFFQKDASEWFGDRYVFYTDLGFEGFWLDMNEPSIFHSEYKDRQKGPKNCGDPLYKGGTRLDDYRNFTHDINGERISHYDVHNLYGGLMTKATSEGLERLLDRRFLLFSRSSYIGAHRYGGIWTGDNSSSWRMLRRNVTMMPGLNMCGFLYSGADTGGFMGYCSRELLLRWLAFSVFTPLMRNHNAIFMRPQECYNYTGRKDFRSILDLRYRLLPYIYSEYMKAALSSDMYIKPLSFLYPDDKEAKGIEDQLIVGENVMIAPVVCKGKKHRDVYLPEDMTQVRWDGKSFTCSDVSKGVHDIKVGLGEVVFFIRKGKCIPIGKKCSNTSEIDLADVTLLGDGDEYVQYLDDGFTRDCGMHNLRTVKR